MPFGLKMSQDVFQTKIDQTFEGCEGVVGIGEDIVVFGKTTEEHDRNMHTMLNRCIDTGLKLNPDKCFVKQEKIKFYGVVCGQDGVQPDPGKVFASKVDASMKGLGAALAQDRKPVTFASKALTDVESIDRYRA